MSRVKEIFKKIKQKKKLSVFLISALIFFASFFSFTFSMRFFPTTDSLPNNYLAINLLFHRRLDLNNLRSAFEKRGLLSLYEGITIKNRNGTVFTKPPPWVGILSIPVFTIANACHGINAATSSLAADLGTYSQYLGKINASFFASLSSVLIFLVLLKISRDLKRSFFSALVYFGATNIFNTASQANWQHAISLFFINLFLLIFLTRFKSLEALFFCGLIGGLFTQIRINNAFYLVFVPVYLVLGQRLNKKTIKLIGCLFFGFLISYFLITLFYRYFEIPYGYQDEFKFSLKEWTPTLFLKNLTALLFSFNYGLFFFSPVLIFGTVAVFRLGFLSFSWVKNRLQRKTKTFFNQEEVLILSLLPTLVLFLVSTASWWMWTGGLINARMLTEALPIFIILVSYSWFRLGRFWIFKAAFWLLFLLSFYINILTVYFWDHDWYGVYTRQGHKSQLRNAWYSDPMFLIYLVKKNEIHLEKFYKKEKKLVVRSRVYRPSIHYRGIVKLFDGERLILDLAGSGN